MNLVSRLCLEFARKKKMTTKKYDIGVVVGRFQVPDLHDGHRKLLELVSSEAKNVLIFIGVAPALGTQNDPLDYTNRAKMLQAAFPKVITVPLMDRPTNLEWSKNLDTMIRTVFPIGTVCLYGGRDSFAKEYDGVFKVQKVDPFNDYTGTDVRAEVGKTVVDSPDFRAGIIYSTHNQYPRLHMTVDVAVYKKHGAKGFAVLLGRKEPHGPLHFPGGFVEPTDESLEMAAVREISEETEVTTHGADSLEYVGSFRINDWRYQKEQRIITAFYATPLPWGTVPSKTDELQDLDFYPLTAANRKNVAEHHQVLWDALVPYLSKEKEVEVAGKGLQGWSDTDV
jgi:bifunctional NMN adenylyltransferase/nudix hydrolase